MGGVTLFRDCALDGREFGVDGFEFDCGRVGRACTLGIAIAACVRGLIDGDGVRIFRAIAAETEVGI